MKHVTLLTLEVVSGKPLKNVDVNSNRKHYTKGRLQKIKTSYLVTLSKKVGGGQDQITISRPLEIMTCSEGGKG